MSSHPDPDYESRDQEDGEVDYARLTVARLVNDVEHNRQLFIHGRNLTQQEIMQSLNDYTTWKNPDRNFLLKLLQQKGKKSENATDGEVPNVRLALAYLLRMRYNHQWREFIQTTLHVSLHKAVNDRVNGRGNSLIHEAARCGYIVAIEDFVDADNVNLLNSKGETPLHFAAEAGHADDVEMLITKGATLKADKAGRTALHLAVMSSQPDAEIIGNLVDKLGKKKGSLLGKRADEERNTALHLAAGNVNMTQDAIGKLYPMDEQVLTLNEEYDTPFHVAARSTNSNLIVWLLDVFGPANNAWDIDDADLVKKKAEQVQSNITTSYCLLDICARSGNSKAVACLIRHGADIKKGVLRTIVTESASRPDEAEKFVAVYREVVDNAVLFECLEKNEQVPLKGSKKYVSELREVMVKLVEGRPKRDKKSTAKLNVIECAIECGASEILFAILNTDHVYRELDSFYVQNPCLDFTSKNLFVPEHYTYDVTGFVRRSTPCRGASDGGNSQEDNEKMNAMPYLTRMMKCEDQWRDTEILKRQPFKQLTLPFISFIQRLYFIAGIIQLVQMVLFTVYMLPTTCSLSQQFSLSLNSCKSDSTKEQLLVDKDSASAFLAWPILLALLGLVDYLSLMMRELKTNAPDSIRFMIQIAKLTCSSDEEIDEKIDREKYKVYRRRTNHEALPTMLLMITVDKLPTFGFCICSFVWYAIYVDQGRYQAYLEIISLVFLFGWLVVFIFFSGISKELYVFSIMLRVTVVKDIVMSFMLVFVATVVGFAFAMHVLRLTTLPEGDKTYINGTVYEVFLAALTMGNFSDATLDENYYISGGRLGFFKGMFAVYVAFTAIILVNVLIAMMSNTYQATKMNAENVWRFRTVAAALRLHDSIVFRSLINMVNCFYFCLCCCCCCCGCEPIYDGKPENEDRSNEVWRRKERWYIDVSLGDFNK